MKMKIAFLLLVHKNYEQVNIFLSQLLKFSHSYIFINIDNKQGLLKEDIIKNERIFFNDNIRDISWGDLSLVDVTLDLLKMAKSIGIDFDYYSLHSGQDLLIKPIDSFIDFLNKNNGYSYMEIGKVKDKTGKLPLNGFIKGGFERIQLNWPRVKSREKKVFFVDLRAVFFYKVILNLYKYGIIKGKKLPDMDFYKGSQWFTLHKDAIDYIFDFIESNLEYYKLFENSCAPDEIFFQSILFNSKLKSKIITHDFRYIYWDFDSAHPKILDYKDFNIIRASKDFFARKFDIKTDKEIITKIVEHLN